MPLCVGNRPICYSVAFKVGMRVSFHHQASRIAEFADEPIKLVKRSIAAAVIVQEPQSPLPLPSSLSDLDGHFKIRHGLRPPPVFAICSERRLLMPQSVAYGPSHRQLEP